MILSRCEPYQAGLLRQTKKEEFQANSLTRMKEKCIFLVLVSVSAFTIYLGAKLVNRTAFTELTPNIYSETLAQMTNRLQIVTTARHRFTQLRIESIKKIYVHSWDNVITPYATKYMIDGKTICNTSSPPSLLIFVLSLPINTKERQAIRRTWGSIASQKNSSFKISTKVVFMLGRMADGTISDKLLQESIEYKDIVQIDFMESRYNLTRKMMHGLRWIQTYCGSIKYILKVDDDTFINLARFLYYLLTDSNINNKTIHGYSYRNGGPVLRKGKYAVKKRELPSSRYPPYVSGTAYILPYDVISDMLDLVERLPYCPVDDAFMTGVLRVILDMKIQHSADFTHMSETKINPCKFHSKIAITNINTNCMYKLWNLTTQAGVRDCKDSKFYDKKVCSIFG